MREPQRMAMDQVSKEGPGAGSENPGLRSVELGLGEEVRIRCLTCGRALLRERHPTDLGAILGFRPTYRLTLVTLNPGGPSLAFMGS